MTNSVVEFCLTFSFKHIKTLSGGRNRLIPSQLHCLSLKLLIPNTFPKFAFVSSVLC